MNPITAVSIINARARHVLLIRKLKRAMRIEYNNSTPNLIIIYNFEDQILFHEECLKFLTF